MPQESYAQSSFVAKLSLPQATAHIMRFALDNPTNRVFRSIDGYWLDMCLTPRPENARGCYVERWGPHRFEKLGDIFLVPPGEPLHVRSDVGEDQTSIVCQIEAGAIDCWLEGGIEWTDRRLEAGLDITDAQIRFCLAQLAKEARNPGLASARMGEMLAGQLAIEVARYCEAIADGPISGGLASWRLRLIDERLHRQGPPPSLAELAELCNISIRQLTRGFRTSRGRTVGEHIAQTRIEAAKRMLGTKDSIKSIAFALGYVSPSSFSYAFRRATGTTPRQFRQRQMRKRI